MIRLQVKNVNSNGYADSIVIPVPIILVGFTIDNSGADQFIQLFDLAALPADGSASSLPDASAVRGEQSPIDP